MAFNTPSALTVYNVLIVTYIVENNSTRLVPEPQIPSLGSLASPWQDSSLSRRIRYPCSCTIINGIPPISSMLEQQPLTSSEVCHKDDHIHTSHQCMRIAIGCGLACFYRNSGGPIPVFHRNVVKKTPY